ncbi:MAG: F0F1 ATP synthase subunit A [Candidatus Komeilibacteria bacterium]|nr:F0F1 ATP synthase subunit A [Candidatus Komeilibacteria bacterium]
MTQLEQQENNQEDILGTCPETSLPCAASKETTEVSHEITLFAEPIFHVGNFTVTNSLLNSWTAVLALTVLALILKKKIAKIPGRLQSFAEVIIEGALNMADSVTGDRQKSQKIFPIVFAIFLFILLNNWLGLLPGIGSIGFIEEGHGEAIFVPLFRGATADLNTTLALALFAVFGSNIFGIFMVGIWKHFNKFVNLKAFAEIPMKIKKEPTIIFVNPIKAFVGIIEIIGEAAKVASLSFRLFGNIFAGEVLLAAMAVIFAFILPVPFMFLEVVVGLIQALIFAMLTLVYFTIASTAEEH